MESQISASGGASPVTTDVFAAARWFDELWNSTARAVSPEDVEWQCTTWGSGRGGGDWTDTAMFAVVIERFGLRSWRNREGRDELVVSVPLAVLPEVVALIDRLGEEPEDWPWVHEEDPGQQLLLAAQVLAMPPAALVDQADLCEALRIDLSIPTVGG